MTRFFVANAKPAQKLGQQIPFSTSPDTPHPAPSPAQYEAAFAAALSWGSDSAARRPHRLPISRPGVILSPMSLDLDPAIEQRLQRQLESGSYSGPDELLSHALDLLEAETGPEDWLSANKEAVRAMIEESVAAEAKGVSYSLEEAEAILAERRAARAASRAA